MHRKILAITLAFLIVLSGSCFAFASPDPGVAIVNPAQGSSSFADNLLVSIKITKPTTIKVQAFQVMRQVGDATPSAITLEAYEKNLKAEAVDQVAFKNFSVMAEETFTTTNNLSFYTKKIEKLQPGVYLVKVDTLDGEGKAIYSNTVYMGLKPKNQAPTEGAIFDSQQSGTLLFLKGLLKSIFPN